MLKHKDDWDEAKEHFKLWWQGEYFGRCVLAVTAPRDGVPDESPPEVPEDPVHRWYRFYDRAA